MDDFVILEIWEGENGFSPYFEVLERIRSDKTYDQISKHNDHFSQLTLGQLIRDGTKLEKIHCAIKGLERLYELKYIINEPYRAICIIQQGKIILLMLMKGSGSNGKLNKFIKNHADTLISILKNIEKNKNEYRAT